VVAADSDAVTAGVRARDARGHHVDLPAAARVADLRGRPPWERRRAVPGACSPGGLGCRPAWGVCVWGGTAAAADHAALGPGVELDHELRELDLR
jgi:hypothetical protein